MARTKQTKRTTNGQPDRSKVSAKLPTFKSITTI